jgi:hypothetical protein
MMQHQHRHQRHRHQHHDVDDDRRINSQSDERGDFRQT